MRTSSRLLALAAAGALTLTACGDDTASPGQVDVTDSPEATSSPSPIGLDGEPGGGGVDDPTTPSATVSPSPDGSTTGSRAAPGESGPHCVIQPALDSIERVEFAYTPGWQVEDGNCEFFDAELEELEQGTEPPAAISVRVADTSFSRAAGTDRTTREDARYVAARSGYQAVRILGESTGRGLRPEGEPALRYLVDLDPGTDDRGGTLVLSARPTDGTTFAQAREALDRMAQTVRVVPSAVGRDGPIVVTRTEGVDPYTVTLHDGCFQLRTGGPADEVADEACELDPTEGRIVGTFLGERVVVGYAPALAAFVVSDAASAPYGAVTAGLEGGSAFAYDATDRPLDVRAIGLDGRVVARATIDG